MFTSIRLPQLLLLLFFIDIAGILSQFFLNYRNKIKNSVFLVCHLSHFSKDLCSLHAVSSETSNTPKFFRLDFRYTVTTPPPRVLNWKVCFLRELLLKSFRIVYTRL